MVKNVVEIQDINNNLLGTGILLDCHVATVDHILSNETNYYTKIDNDIYPAQVIYRGKDMEIPVDIAMLSVEIEEKYKPNIIEVRLNDKVETKGFPKGDRYAIYQKGRHVSGKVISFNYIDMSSEYSYCGNYITIASDEEITSGFSGAPVFVGDAIIGFIARKHIDGKPNNFNVVPISYYINADNGIFRDLFGKYISIDRKSFNNNHKKSLINPFHFRSETIDFVGRSNQIDQLFQFCSSVPSVQWWAITGVGGIGKSRLAYEFVRSLNENIWDAIMLNTYDYESLKKISLHVKKNTLIVLDYVQQNIRDIGKWLYTLAEVKSDYKIRVLLLERYGKSYRTAKWIERLNERNCEYDALVNMCYNPTMCLDPQFLVLPSLLKEELVSIAENYCNYNNTLIESSTIQSIINQLDILDPGYNRPLYLIFLIDAWLDNKDLSNWNKKFILESVLIRELHRIKLILRNFIYDDLLINAYLSVLVYSTIMDGLEYPYEFEAICAEESKVFQESMKYHRKDIIAFFSQMGFLAEDNEGGLYFEGLKPDLLGEYFLLNYNLNNKTSNNIIQQSLLFPQRAFSFYHRLLDDYSAETDSNIRLSLLNINTNDMSIDKICFFAEFLCERIARDNRKHSVQCLKRLNLLYMQNKVEDTAIIYATGLFNMVEQLNLKKSKKLLLELKNLYDEYGDSFDVAMEYAYALLNVIERKSLYAAQKDFENLKMICKRNLFINNLEFNLCYAKALKILCSKEVDRYASFELCKELHFVFLRFSEEEFACIYAQCLCSLNINTNNINKILTELLLLSDYTLVQPIYASYIIDNFKAGILSKAEALNWLQTKRDFNLYIDRIEELNRKKSLNEKEGDYKPEILKVINLDTDKARKLVWLSNNLNYKQCKGVVMELKALCKKYNYTYEFIEYYLIGLVTLSKHTCQDSVELYQVFEKILIISNKFFDNFDKDLRLSIYESISNLAKKNLIDEDLTILLEAFIHIITKELCSEQETVKIMSFLLLILDLKFDVIICNYFEDVIKIYNDSNDIQRQYIKYMDLKNDYDLEYIFQNLSRFYSYNCLIIFNNLVKKILTFSSANTDENVIDYIENFLSLNKADDLAIVYSKLILERFLKKPGLEYYNILKTLEVEYHPNVKIALNYAKLLYKIEEKKLLDIYDIYNCLKKLNNAYSDEKIALLYQKILSKMVIDSISSNFYEKYIKEQEILFDLYGNLEFALEYCNSLSVVSRCISDKENTKNYIKIKEVAKHFQKREVFNSCLKTIVCELEKSNGHFRVQETASEEELFNLKRQIQRLHFNGGYNDVLRVEKVVKRVREAYQEFSNVDFAILLCRGLFILSKLVSNKEICEIVGEIEVMYNRYSNEPTIFKNYLRVVICAISSNCKLEREKIDSLEKMLVKIIREDIRCGGEIYNVLLLILHIKNNKIDNEQLIELELDTVIIPITKSSKKRIDSVLYHFHVWGTLDKPIEVINIKGQFILLDGYERWVVANNNNMKLISARVLAEY